MDGVKRADLILGGPQPVLGVWGTESAMMAAATDSEDLPDFIVTQSLSIDTRRRLVDIGRIGTLFVDDSGGLPATPTSDFVG